MLNRRAFLAASALLIIALGTSAALGQQEANQKQDAATALCSETVAALQQTAAAPLAKLLSVQAGTVLVVVADKPIVLAADTLAGKEKWADQPLLSPQAKLGEIKSSDRLYAVRVRGEIADGDKTLLLDGVALGEGQRLKWGMLAVVPKPDEGTTDEQSRKEILGLLSAWGQGLAGGNADPMLDSLYDEMAFGVVGPDYGFYVFKDREDMKMAVEEAMAQGVLSVQFVSEPRVTVAGQTALLSGTWKLDVGGNAVTLDCWAHMVKTANGWRVVGFFALPPKQ